MICKFQFPEIRKLFDRMAQHWTVEEEPKRNVMLKNLRLVKLLLNVSYGSVVGAVMMHLVWRLFLISFSESYKIENGSSIMRPQFFVTKFYFETKSSPAFEIIWVCQFIGTIFTGTAFGVYEGFFMIVVFHLSTQLKVLTLDIRDLNDLEKQQNFSQLLKPIVCRHLQLKRYVLTKYKFFHFEKLG